MKRKGRETEMHVIRINYPVQLEILITGCIGVNP